MATRASRPTIGLVILTVLSLMLSLVAYVRPVQATHTADPTDHPLVDPAFFPGATNRTCGDVDEADYEFKINIQNPNGTFNEDSGSVTVTPDEPTDFEVTLTTTTSGGQVFLKFESNLPVQSVFLKGGTNGSHLYDYAEYPTAQDPEPVTYDERLQVPGGSDISHVSFCFDELPLLPALEITKTPDAGVVNAGDPISFSITVMNTGDADATNVGIDDTLHPGFAWTDDRDECSITPSQVLNCDIPTLAPDASFTVTVSALTDGTVCGPIPNTAFADADSITQIDDDGQVTVNCADIRIEKTPDGGDVEIGGAITFVLTVHNDGAGVARGVVVTDNLPGSGWSIVAAETTLASCGLVGDDLTCGPDTIDAGASKKVTVTRTAVFDADCGRIDNTANVDTSNDGDDSDTSHVDVLCADIDVDKTPDGAQVTAGDAATFSIVTTNTGNATATGVTLVDALPDAELGWTIVAADTDWADCSITGAAGDPQTLTCGPESIGAGDDRTVKVTTTATAEDCGLLNNPKAEATTTNDGADDDAGSINVLCADIDVDKSPDGAEAYAGDDVAFTIVTTNLGDGEARDVTLSDTLPAVENGWSIDASLTDWADCSIIGAAGDPQTLSCGPEDVAAAQGNTRTVVVTTTLTSENCGPLNNPAANVDTSNDGDDTDAGSMTVLCPDVNIEKTAGDPVSAGGLANFEITVTAGGTGTSTNVQVTDNLIGEQGDWTFDVTGADDVDCGITADPKLLCDFGNLAAGTVITIALTYQTDADDCPSVANSATVTSDDDTNVNNNSSERVTVDVDCPDLELTKQGSEPVSAGDGVSFTITVENNADGDAANVVLTDNLPGDGLGLWSVVESVGIDEADCDITDDVLTCTLVELAAGASFSVTVAADTDSDACPSVENDASVSADNEPAQDVYSNTDSAVVTVNCPDLKVDKAPVESPISAGELGEFTILVWNVGPGTAFDVTVTDTAPLGTVWTVLDDDGFDCDDAIVGDQQTLTCELDELAPGEENARTIRIRYETSQDDCGTLTNAVAVAAENEPLADTEDNSDRANLVVECPGLNMVKTADADTIDAGETASYTITVWNLGPGTAFDVLIEDTIPAGWTFDDGGACDELASSVELGEPEAWSCIIHELAPVSDMADGIQIHVFGPTTRDDCGELTNTAFASASNSDDELERDATIEVKCPTIALEKANDQAEPLLPGTEVTYTLTLTVDDGPAKDVEVVDLLPDGLDDPTDISDGGVFDATAGTITWSLGDLADGEYTLTYQAVVSADAEHGDELVNVAAATSPNTQCPDLESLEPECEDSSTVTVRVPTLVIDKAADTEVITITIDGDDQTVDPEVVTWTLTYTLTNGPVTNAVIRDELPAGLVYVDGSASDGGVYDAATNTLTWTFATLSESGSVTYKTEVDPETISRVAPTVNVAVISSDQTPEDEGEDQVTVTVEQELGGNPTPTPKPRLPDTAVGIGPGGHPVTIPVELLAAAFMMSLGALALANVRASRGRRR